jgi:tetratricopeptide (TPR) repeat protein
VQTKPATIPGMSEEKNSFLDVGLLLEESQPRRRGGWFWYAVGFFLLVVILSAWAQKSLPNGGQIVQAISSLMMFALMIAMAALTFAAARSVQKEQAKLEAIEELIKLRRWEEAGVMVRDLLSKPTRAPAARTQGLVYLAAVLARYHRFGDAISIYEHLLENRLVDAELGYAMKLGRAMSLLREDRLVDADRAMGELKRGDRAEESGGLALLEIYRDVKTGHAREAIEIFERKREVIRRQLVHRSADAYALVAKAYDTVGEAERAKENFEKATLLSPVIELKRRYPEIAGIEEKYGAAPLPAEVAA